MPSSHRLSVRRAAMAAAAALVLAAPTLAAARTPATGRIVLQVQRQGQAWYVNPRTGRRYSLGTPEQAVGVLRAQATGISDKDLKRIPLGLGGGPAGFDTDKDGMSDAMEDAVGTDRRVSDTDHDSFIDGAEIRAGYDPLGIGRPSTDLAFAAAQKGRVFLQAQGHGELWWVNPADGRRYFVGGGEGALDLMRTFGLGISEADLAAIPRG
jgi:hypothetical protein